MVRGDSDTPQWRRLGLVSALVGLVSAAQSQVARSSRVPRLTVGREWFTIAWRRQRLIMVGVVASLGLNLFLWIAQAFWYHFSPLIAWFGTGVILVNGTLAVALARKEPVLTQAIILTMLTVELLLVVLVVRTGAFTL